ncbi:hypothetical protein [Nocardiopsis sp. TNDT3]|uniref:hypothetical protein n=1 Tax=Nocardiopsis sp. TNDT3 TaxID=2249354 RepID=UPI0013009702|nr:hypothetical protein [Nocardiopsis sp. TNDT3]
MNINWSDPAWWSALSALCALLVSLVSLWAAFKSSEAARRSAAADELSTRLAQGLARTCHARWEITSRRVAYTTGSDGHPIQEDYGIATLTNTGEEVALNVQAMGGDSFGHEPVDKIQPGESCDFQYEAVLPDERKEVFIEWDRPKEFGEERMRTRRIF